MKKIILISIVVISISILAITDQKKTYRFGMYSISYMNHNDLETFYTTSYTIDAKTKCIEFVDEVGDIHTLCNYKINEW
jgi:hypothetical protein